MCGFADRLGWAEIFSLDRLSSRSYYWAMKARRLDLGPEDVLRLRRRMGMTQRQFADIVGVDPITVSRWERGETKVSMAYSTHIRQVTDEVRQEAAAK